MSIKQQIPLIFELSEPGRTAYSLPECDVPTVDPKQSLPDHMLRQQDARLPEVSEVDVVRHYTQLSQLNYGLDAGFYPLGSCTMKYNPKVNEDMAALEGFAALHPYANESSTQGAMQLMVELEAMLCEISGMDAMTLIPAAGAHGEMTGQMIIKAYHESRGDFARKKIIIPDAAHGTNPASAVMAGFDTVQIPTKADGDLDLDALRAAMDDTVAGLMLTNPSTLGLFERQIGQVAQIVHDAGGLLYYDGANANAIIGISRPGDMGFDVVHLNLHKTFSTPHGGGGPGAGPVGVKSDLIPFLPGQRIIFDGKAYSWDKQTEVSIGQVKAFYGNFLVLVKAYCYILSLGAKGLADVAKGAVLNANYIQYHLKEDFYLPYDRTCMHECVFSGKLLKERYGVTTLDIAKRLLDYGYHPPTIYFPMIVEEALMIEPTECESRRTLDQFIACCKQIVQEAAENPELLKQAPQHTPVRRLDETGAARNPVLKWQFEE